MIRFFIQEPKLFAVSFTATPDSKTIEKLEWLFDGAKLCKELEINGCFIGSRSELITPWSTNAVDICSLMNITIIDRIETFTTCKNPNLDYDKLLYAKYTRLDQDLFNINKKAESVKFIDNIANYNKEYGLALNTEEIQHLQNLSKKLGRSLTDSEVYGFSQVNSEHCRHKIFNGTFIIDNEKQEFSLFDLIKKTSALNPKYIISAYKDNVAFIKGPQAILFTVNQNDQASFFIEKDINTVISLKAETHNFPTTVEPFYGASTGSGGEIRDRMAGGIGSIPLSGTAVYCTSYSRVKDNSWQNKVEARPWIYKSPDEILVTASNGASDFGNKFGQPLICGSVLTFEHSENDEFFGFDKVIMLAGGIGYTLDKYAKKHDVTPDDLIVLLGGDNYRIGMGGGAVSSVNTGELSEKIELNAVQRANPELQKRIFNVIRAMVESDDNKIISIHDHGAGGHLNCFSELIETTGGVIDITKLPIGDPSLSDKEIICNESQERMGLLIDKSDFEYLSKIANREKAPIYAVGKATNDNQLVFENHQNIQPINLEVNDLLGLKINTVINDKNVSKKFAEPTYSLESFNEYLENVLTLESVGCKDWLTNKVDRSVSGKVALQQNTGPLQLPLNNLGINAIDYNGTSGIATSIGHAPIPGLIKAEAGSILAVAEALTNLVWAPLKHGLSGVALSANWMWSSNSQGEATRLYQAVKGLSDFAIELGISVPTGKDSLFMTQQYPDGKKVIAPGTVIVSAVAEVEDIKQTVQPYLKHVNNSSLIFVRFTKDKFALGGSSLYQTLNAIGDEVPYVSDANYFSKVFNLIQDFIKSEYILAGHDISAGGMITALLEMCFPNPNIGLDINLAEIEEQDIIKLMFNESPGVLIQTNHSKAVVDKLIEKDIKFYVIGKVIDQAILKIIKNEQYEHFDIAHWRDIWYGISYTMDTKQTQPALAKQRFDNYKNQALDFIFPQKWNNIKESLTKTNLQAKTKRPKSAIIREKGSNGDREMAYALYYAGFDVKDVHMTDLISGQETLEDISMIVFVGGFSNSDVLGSAKGWAGTFLYNENAKKALDNFYARPDTLSLGVCNGCQLMIELGLITSNSSNTPKMLHNDSKKFESAFLSVDIPKNNSIMLNSLEGSKLGVWIAHGEGKFSLPLDENKYNIPMKYSYAEYPGNPNGSDYTAAGLCSDDGRHLAIMPHIERSLFPWQWGVYYDKSDIISPWIIAFVAAREWVEKASNK